MTQSLKTKYRIFSILSLLLNVGPLAVYVIKALICSTFTHQKIALSMTVLIVLILTIISLVNKVVMKSRLWIILIGLYICLEYILTPLIIIGVCQVVDELIVSPLKVHYRDRYKINKEIDLRQ